jgi:hypothetical protein
MPPTKFSFDLKNVVMKRFPQNELKKSGDKPISSKMPTAKPISVLDTLKRYPQISMPPMTKPVKAFDVMHMRN